MNVQSLLCMVAPFSKVIVSCTEASKEVICPLPPMWTKVAPCAVVPYPRERRNLPSRNPVPYCQLAVSGRSAGCGDLINP